MSSTFKEGQKYSLKELVNKIKVGFVGSCNKYYCDSKNRIPMIRTTNLTNSGVNLENIKYVTEDFFNKNPKSQLHKGDILIARHGNNGLASIWTHNFKAQCLNVVIIEPNEEIMNNYYLYYMFNSAMVQRQIKAKVGGSVQGVVNTKDISEILIPYYKLDHQKKVSNILLTMDTKITLMEQKQGKLVKFKSYLLNKIFKSNLSDDWMVKKLSDIAIIGKGFTPSTHNPDFWNGEYSWLSIADMSENDKSKYIIDSKKTITKEGTKNKDIIKKGTLIMSFKLSVGKLSILKKDMYTNEAICNFTWKNEDISTEYMYYYLSSINIMKYGAQAVKGVTLNNDSLNSIPVKLPSFKVQEKIASFLSYVDKKIELLNNQIDLMKTYKRGLLQKMFI
ncbi:restriction endonuclease subunit S [Methanosphaera cuniculi]|nr:restriction endonuclease subunit S [Methanosphaera cuniculi]